MLLENLDVEGLGEVIIRPAIAAFLLVFVGKPGCQHDDRNVGGSRIGFDPPAEFVAVHVGHHHIGEHDVGTKGFHLVQRRLPVRGRDDIILGRKDAGEIIQEVLAVVYQQQVDSLGGGYGRTDIGRRFFLG